MPVGKNFPVLFPLPTKATPTDEWASPANIVKFGDGYEQRSPDGLNRPRESWNVEVFYASDAAAETLNNFLLEHGQHKPFQWKPPRDAATAQNYVITGAVSGSTRRGGGDKPWFWTRSMRFDRWYGAVSAVVSLPTVTISAPSSVVEDSTVDAVIARSGATTSSLTVNYVVSGTAISGTDYSPLSGTATIPIGSSAVDVPVKALTDSLTEDTESIVITLSSNPNYLVVISNVLGVMGGLLRDWDGLQGAQVTRTKLKQPAAGTYQFTQSDVLGIPDIYTIDRATNHTRLSVTLELRSIFDLGNRKVPRRSILQSVCPYVYQSAECGYTGTLPACDRNISDCLAHFQSFVGDNPVLNFGGFPNVDRLN